MEVVGGAQGEDEDVGEGAGVEAVGLDVVAKGGEVAVESAELAAAPVVVRVLLLRGLYRHFHLRPEAPRRRRRVAGAAARVFRFHFCPSIGDYMSFMRESVILVSDDGEDQGSRFCFFFFRTSW